MSSEEHDHSHSHSHHHHDVEVKGITHISPTEVKVAVSIPADVLTREEAMITQKYARSAQLPGFRPGKAPMAIVKQKFKDAIKRDMLSHLIEAGLTEALQKSKLVPISEPEVRFGALTEGKPLDFEASFEVEPEISLKKYKGAPLTRTEAVVTDEEVSQTVDGLRDRMAILEPLEQESPSAGCFAETEIGFILEEDGKPKNDMPVKPFTVEVGNGKLLPEIDAGLMAMKVGEEKQIPAKFPADYFEQTLADRSAVFSVKLLELKKKTLPDLTDDWANTIKPGATLLSLRQDIRANIESSKKEENQKQHRQHVVDFLIQNNPLTVPRSMVMRQAKRLVSSMEEDLKRGGKLPKLGDQELKSLEESAERIVRSSLLLRAVAEKENISLEEGRWKARIEALAQGTNQTIDQVEKFLEGQGILNRLKDEVLTDQVFDFLISHGS